jgi:hypothetical protein
MFFHLSNKHPHKFYQIQIEHGGRRGYNLMVFNTTFNNISVISWWSVLLVEETGVPGENHLPVTSR